MFLKHLLMHAQWLAKSHIQNWASTVIYLNCEFGNWKKLGMPKNQCDHQWLTVRSNLGLHWNSVSITLTTAGPRVRAQWIAVRPLCVKTIPKSMTYYAHYVLQWQINILVVWWSHTSKVIKWSLYCILTMILLIVQEHWALWFGQSS